MEYIIFPAEDLKVIPQTLSKSKLTLVYNKDKTQVVTKLSNYKTLFPMNILNTYVVDTDTIVPTYPYPVYGEDSINEILNTDDWRSSNDESNTDSVNKPIVKLQTD